MAIRTFIALDTPDTIRNDMLALQKTLRESDADVRWEPKEKFHATIKFLGDTDEKRLPEIAAAIAESVRQSKPFEITYAGLGCFPDAKRPRVIWVGCMNEDGTLETLKNFLDRDLHPFGFEREERKFHPHITLGRVKSNKRLEDLTPLLQNLTFQPQSVHCREVLLMKSVLKPTGSEYRLLQKFSLRGKE